MNLYGPRPQALAYTSDEASAMMLMKRERARKKIREHAATIIQAWWLKHMRKTVSTRKEQVGLSQVTGK